MTTTEEMNLEIQEAIKKSLPNQVGEALKKKLEKADVDALQVVTLSNMLDEKRKNLQTLQNEITEYQKLDERNKLLETRENAVSEQERNLKVTMAELKLAESEKRNVDMVNLTALVFKSPVYKSFVSEHKGGSAMWNQTTQSNSFIENGSKTTTTEKKEE